MKSVSKEDRINESSHAIQVLSKSVETFGKIEDLSVKNKDNELTQRNNQPFFWDFDYGKPDDYSFGTRQQRQLFPHSHPPTWLGNKFLPLRGMPHTGPGCYTASDWNGLAYNLSQTPTSTKGYAIGARTAVRFKPVKDVTPHPGMYQKFYAWNDKYKQSFAPFNALMPRFRTDVKGNSYPGPGTYNPEKKSPLKVVWPMKFGSPDWSQIPRLEKRTLKAELSTDKDFRKHRNRVAYLSLYYN
uniref:Ciliary microtubule associated protein 3 n=1 Tax=Cricetulus griseus TaxID=10029 RepID=A0A8C2QGP4_CRIGR